MIQKIELNMMYSYSQVNYWISHNRNVSDCWIHISNLYVKYVLQNWINWPHPHFMKLCWKFLWVLTVISKFKQIYICLPLPDYKLFLLVKIWGRYITTPPSPTFITRYSVPAFRQYFSTINVAYFVYLDCRRCEYVSSMKFSK